MQYIFDVDGTLSFDGETISESINNAIKDLMLAGNEVIFDSARPIRDLLPMIPEFQSQKLIGANGAMISINNEIEVIKQINSSSFEYLKVLIQRYNLDYVIDSSWNYSSRITQNSFIEKMIDPSKFAQKIKIDEIENPIKTIFVNVEIRLQEKLLTMINQETPLNAIGLAGERTVDITAKDINKFFTLDKLGIENYIAFGNDRNDFEMLQSAQTSVWIESKKNLKSYSKNADIVCQPNSEAVAELIRSFLR
ncbi:hydrolase [Companilactobacillus crustorum]|uniref:HAD superfamily hydrolase n=3 Tax=Companilactobacillus TaxID=2767879 RepID=A0A837RIX1_9LACO|nr:HAD family hydrolase [Companilactobacillus crustorum]KRK42407.1 HAD superfamily hydrolase [Companilactobacillus crustorum JCM 15951]KRO21255.1 HAD superfamily hydrolase [Companilactobacillus crustorum]GEO76624.1 hydrolase [Companilactobacillus crustorum]